MEYGSSPSAKLRTKQSLRNLKERISNGDFTYNEALEIVEANYESSIITPDCDHILKLQYFYDGEFLAIYFRSSPSKGYLYQNVESQLWGLFCESKNYFTMYNEYINKNDLHKLPNPNFTKLNNFKKQSSCYSDRVNNDEDSTRNEANPTSREKLADTVQLEKSLDNFRKKLLDLSLRNPLISFKETGAKVVPVIDELPDELYRILVDKSQAMTLDPLMPVSQERQKQDGHFNNTHDSLLIENSKAKVTKSTELSVIETNQDKPKKKTKLEAVPDPNAANFQNREQYTDNRIQTSLSLKEYENRLANVKNSYNEFIHSTGENYLYLAIGFIKWYKFDPKESKYTPRSAPLVLIPIDITQEIETIKLIGEDGVEISVEHYVYSVSHSGESVLSNNTFNLFLQSKNELPNPDSVS